MSFSIRQATIHDLDTLVPLFDGYRQFYLQPTDPERGRRFLAERFAHHESVILLASDERGAGLGFVQLYPLFSSVSATRMYLLNDLFVSANARRQGVAKSLMTVAADLARKLGAVSMTLATALDNQPAQALYESLGWQREKHFCEYVLALT
ncbi:GNAT family N-acetyltransferase [Dyella caseinilytica]|uniref:GNAT family N-acetyltransferase n=1 Tax=Dyella caseinilytica TaxID=1849581 RepID=A0ABX7GX81_9GAMM|nr:GNAT family N-acetyltransferase [Dyella caseinilytica]QRN54628.1 GNAT family N-acetyltransferase [Dyella caseinilytica]GFZ95629.1 putative N-acetyltransferase YhfO [Dyella caseinilytica]